LFGYVRIYKPLLRFCEYDAYKAIYCSICRELGRTYGFSARILLNYDFTFVAMLHMALHGERPDYQRKRCVCNPLKHCNFCKEGDDAFKLTSAMTVEFFYHKLLDNIADSGFFGGLGWRLLKLFAVPMHKKASRLYPELSETVARCTAEQAQAERKPDCSVDEAADPSARMLSELAVYLSEKEMDKTVLRDFGYYFGRWIYLIDAFDDLADDVRKGSFNPFALRFGLTAEDIENDSKRLEETRLYANECLNMTVARVIKAFDLLNTGAYSPIFYNILMNGLGEAQRIALHEKEMHTT